MRETRRSGVPDVCDNILTAMPDAVFFRLTAGGYGRG
jgi:hypothetical protein